jgi:hypothetical protein
LFLIVRFTFFLPMSCRLVRPVVGQPSWHQRVWGTGCQFSKYPVPPSGQRQRGALAEAVAEL